jgi:hypothetical protein
MAQQERSQFQPGQFAQPVAQRQHIRMRLHNHPVKHDGEITEFAPDGSSFVVQFIGPFPSAIRFYLYRDKLVIDKPMQDGAAPAGANTWEVL